MLEQKGIYAVLKNNLSLLEGLEFTPPSSARTKGDDTRYYVYTYLVRIPTFFFWIFRLMRYTDVRFFSLLPDTYVQHLVRIPTFSFWFSVWWHIPTSAFFHSYQIRMYNTCRCTINSTAVSLFVYSWVVVRMIPTFRPWTHTSDDSYMYQLSLVVATATVSLFYYCRRYYSMTT